MTCSFLASLSLIAFINGNENTLLTEENNFRSFKFIKWQFGRFSLLNLSSNVTKPYCLDETLAMSSIEGVALPVIEIIPKEGFYDYKNKYQPGATVETCPAELSAELTEKVQNIAEKAFKVLRLRDYVRFDFIMDREGNFYCLEANTLPGMTPNSLIPRAAKVEGMSYDELCEEIVQLSVLEVRG